MDKLVFVKELRSGITKTQKTYPLVLDQDNEQWHIFNAAANDLRVNASYLFSFEINEKGFKDIQSIKPLVNVFHQKALKEVASRNDLTRNISVATSYAISLVNGGNIPLDDVFLWADKIYDYNAQKLDILMPVEKPQ